MKVRIAERLMKRIENESFKLLSEDLIIKNSFPTNEEIATAVDETIYQLSIGRIAPLIVSDDEFNEICNNVKGRLIEEAKLINQEN